MVLLKKINPTTNEFTEESIAITDCIAGPKYQIEQITTSKWDAIVAAYEDGTIYENDDAKETAILGMLGLTTNLDQLSLADLKLFCKRKIKRQAQNAYEENYSLLDGDNAVVAVIGVADPIDRTKALWAGFRAEVLAYRLARKAAYDAIDAATTKEEVMAVTFVTPA